MKIKNPLNPIIHSYYKLSNWGKILLFVVLLLALVIFFKFINHDISKKEGFKEGIHQNNDFVFLSGTDLYDNFYVDIYDDLVYSQVKDEYEIDNVCVNFDDVNETDIFNANKEGDICYTHCKNKKL
jgi:hypothetical protein